MRLTPASREALRSWLLDRYPWLAADDVGPRSVPAGECDRCGLRPRLLPTCGPTAWTALCQACAEAVGADGWCDGHRDDGVAARAWAAALPPEWPTVVRLWWVATGEVRLDPGLLAAARDRLELPALENAS